MAAPSTVAAPSAAAAALARSGIMALTGWPAGPPLLPPWQLAVRLQALTGELYRVTASQGRPVFVSWEAAVAGRAALLGLRRGGQTSPNGSCRLLRTADAWVALNLPRPTDADLIPALTGQRSGDAWAAAGAMAAVTPAADFAARARLLGLAAAPLVDAPTTALSGAPATAPTGAPSEALAEAPTGDPAPAFTTATAAQPYTSQRRWSTGSTGPVGPWRVVDLSSLWAGPLVARILAEAGAGVTKVESITRPDGARATPRFYQWLHPANEEAIQVDLATAEGRQHVAALIQAADVVIEASRPRALQQLGLGPDDHPDRPGRIWLSITGHGREGPGQDWIAFGDDAAVAGGLVARDEHGDPVFCGDAIADPLTGLTGALAVLAARQTGGGVLIDLAMSRTAAAGAGRGASGPDDPQAEATSPVVEPDRTGEWRVRVGRQWEVVRPHPADLNLIRSVLS